jgi:hypothetical protein
MRSTSRAVAPTLSDQVADKRDPNCDGTHEDGEGRPDRPGTHTRSRMRSTVAA